MSKKVRKGSLPQPNAKFRPSGETAKFTPEEIRGMVCNPVYAGIGAFPAVVSDEQWVAAATMAIQKEGAEQFLVNLLHVLRETFAEDDV